MPRIETFVLTRSTARVSEKTRLFPGEPADNMLRFGAAVISNYVIGYVNRSQNPSELTKEDLDRFISEGKKAPAIEGIKVDEITDLHVLGAIRRKRDEAEKVLIRGCKSPKDGIHLLDMCQAAIDQMERLNQEAPSQS